MATETRNAKMRVLNDQVDAGKGKHIPPGDYSGTIVKAIVMMRGRRLEQVTRVQIFISEEIMAEMFGRDQNPSRIGIDADVTKGYLDGHVVEA